MSATTKTTKTPARKTKTPTPAPATETPAPAAEPTPVYPPIVLPPPGELCPLVAVRGAPIGPSWADDDADRLTLRKRGDEHDDKETIGEIIAAAFGWDDLEGIEAATLDDIADLCDLIGAAGGDGEDDGGEFPCRTATVVRIVNGMKRRARFATEITKRVRLAREDVRTMVKAIPDPKAVAAALRELSPPRTERGRHAWLYRLAAALEVKIYTFPLQGNVLDCNHYNGGTHKRIMILRTTPEADRPLAIATLLAFAVAEREGFAHPAPEWTWAFGAALLGTETADEQAVAS